MNVNATAMTNAAIPPIRQRGINRTDKVNGKRSTESLMEIQMLLSALRGEASPGKVQRGTKSQGSIVDFLASPDIDELHDSLTINTMTMGEQELYVVNALAPSENNNNRRAASRSHGIDFLPQRPRRVESRIASSPPRRTTITPPPELDESFEISEECLPLSNSPPQRGTKEDKRPSLKDERYYPVSSLGIDSIDGSGDYSPSKQEGKRPSLEDKRYDSLSSLGMGSLDRSGKAPSISAQPKRPSFEDKRDNTFSTLGLLGSLDGSNEGPRTPRQENGRSLQEAKRNTYVLSSFSGMGSFDASSEDPGSLLDNGPPDRWVQDYCPPHRSPTDKEATASPPLQSRKSHTVSNTHRQTSLSRNTLAPPKSYRSRIISQTHESVYEGKDPRLQVPVILPQPPSSPIKISSPSQVFACRKNDPQNSYPAYYARAYPPPPPTMPAPSYFHSAMIYHQHYNLQTQVPSPQSPSATADPYPHIRMEHAPEKAKGGEAHALVVSPVEVTTPARRVNNDYNNDGLATPRSWVSSEDYTGKSRSYRSPPGEATPKSCLPIPRFELSPPAAFKSTRLKGRVSQNIENRSPTSVMNVPGSETVSPEILKRMSMANKFKSMVSPVQFSNQLPSEELKTILDHFFDE